MRCRSGPRRAAAAACRPAHGSSAAEDAHVRARPGPVPGPAPRPPAPSLASRPAGSVMFGSVPDSWLSLRLTWRSVGGSCRPSGSSPLKSLEARSSSAKLSGRMSCVGGKNTALVEHRAPVHPLQALVRECIACIPRAAAAAAAAHAADLHDGACGPARRPRLAGGHRTIRPGAHTVPATKLKANHRIGQLLTHGNRPLKLFMSKYSCCSLEGSTRLEGTLPVILCAQRRGACCQLLSGQVLWARTDC